MSLRGSADNFPSAFDAAARRRVGVKNGVNIQVTRLPVALGDEGLRFGGGRCVAMVAERGFGDDRVP